MTNPRKPDHLRKLISEIESMTSPRTLGDLVQGATGLFIPGFTAFPAVTLLSKRSWKMKIKPKSERWQTGDLVYLQSESGAAEGSKEQKAFFTPVGEVTIPLIDITPARETSRYVKRLALKPKDLWEPCELSFAFLPWDTDRQGQAWTPSELLSISNALELIVRELKVTMEIGSEVIPIVPKWGLSPLVPEPTVESILFPLNYAARIISPFMFSLCFSSNLKLSSGKEMRLHNETLELNFEFSENSLRSLYKEAGISETRITGISVFGNVLPVANIDLKAWELHDGFAECVRTAGMKPLGIAGVFPYSKDRQNMREHAEPSHSYDTLFSLEIDPSGMVLTHYDVPGRSDTSKSRQLFLWMTYGDKLNGYTYKFYDYDIIQPMQKKSVLLNQTYSILPCFGGYDSVLHEKEDLYKRILMNYSIPPNTLLYKDTLVYTIDCLLRKFGYRGILVREPESELRVINGNCRSAIVVYLENKSGRALNPRHLEIIRDFIEGLTPIGVRILLELI